LENRGAEIGGMMAKLGKYEKLCAHIRKKEGLLVALSGGVDSSLVALLAVQILGDRALAVTLDSELLPRRERDMAHMIAKKVGIRHIIKRIVLLDETLCQNTPQRCFYCKKKMADVLWGIAQKENIATIADGITQNDLEDKDYVGIKAWTQAGIWHPLAQYGFTKTEVSILARDGGLEIWHKPPEACLATRLGTHETITLEKLKMIQDAEDFLVQDFPHVRVRVHNGLARIEVPKEDLKKALRMGEKISKKLKKIGFTQVTLDLEGYKMGSMNTP
jgi:uncharacterized protein